MIAAWWVVAVGAAEAVDPALRGVPGAEGVTVERGATWKVTVRGRTVEVAPARTPEAEEALRALVSSLLADLPLGSVDGPAERALAELDARLRPAAPARAPIVAAPAALVAPEPPPAAPEPVRAAPDPEPVRVAGIAPPAPRPAPPLVTASLAATPARVAPPAPPATTAPAPAPRPTAAAQADVPAAVDPPRRRTGPVDAAASTARPAVLPSPIPNGPRPTAPRPASAAVGAASAGASPGARWPVTGWIGPEVVVRSGVAAGPGAAVGATAGDAYGGAVRLAYRPARATSYGTSTRLTEVAAEVTGFAALTESARAPVALRGGFALAGRRYALALDTVSVHVVPQAVAGLSAGASLGGWRGELGLNAEFDLVTTRIGWSTADEVLQPAALRAEIRLGPGRPRIETNSSPTVEPERGPPTPTGTTEDEVTP